MLTIIIALLLGFLTIQIFWPSDKIFDSGLPVKFFISTGLGLGIASCLFFVLIILNALSASILIISEVILFILLLITAILTLKNKSKSQFGNTSSIKPAKLLSISFYVSLFLSVISFLLSVLRFPHGTWDAWLIWNMHARFIARSGTYFLDFFKSGLDWARLDYPLLLPSIIAGGWKYAGHEMPLIPIIIAVIFTFSGIGLLYSSVSILRGKNQALIAGLILLATPAFIRSGASQCADIPIAFFFLASIILLYFYDKSTEKKPGLLILAGITAGLAAWTKNEGLLFLAAIIISRFSIIFFGYKARAVFNQILLFAIGLLPVLLIIIFFKTQIATANDIFINQNFGSITDRLMDLSRYSVILKEYIIHSITFSSLAVFLMIAYVIVFGVKIEKQEKSGLVSSIIVLSIMLTGYFFIYIITPHNLKWHIDTSINRLFLQLWPSLIFIFSMLVRPLEEFILNKKENS